MYDKIADYLPSEPAEIAILVAGVAMAAVAANPLVVGATAIATYAAVLVSARLVGFTAAGGESE